MLRTLRSRLLLSYTFVIAVMLVVLGLFLLVALAVSQRARLLPQLESLVRADREVMTTLRGQAPAAGASQDQLEEAIHRAAGDLNTRLLIVDLGERVLLDSRDGLVDQTISLAPFTSLLLSRRNLLDPNVQLVRFRDENSERWLGVARSLGPRAGQRGLRLVNAIPEGTPLAIFQDNFFWPLAQAGGAAFLVALGLAWWISRSVTRPLRQMSQAAEAIAEGDYREELPPEGPEEVRLLAGSFNQMAQKVAQTQQSQREFVANVSHDLKTPLTSIQGWSQALLDGTAADPGRVSQAAQVIHEESTRMTRMVNQLLALARLEGGLSEARRQPVALAGLLEDVRRSLLLQAQQKEIDLAAGWQGVDGIVLADRDQLVQLVTNLVENALAHTPRGGRVALKLWQEKVEEIWLGVQDTGPGIPPAELPRIFERFYQVDKSRSGRQRGSGLGLAIVRQIAEAHGGRVEVSSLEGQGSLFRVCLPLDRR